MENLQRDFDHIIKSDRFKPGYSANPKSVLTNHISALVKAGWTVSGAYELESGYVDGERQVVKRASITVSVDPPIVAYGDGKSKVDAEKAAAFHAICLLLEHGILGGGKGKGAKNIKPNPAAAIPSSSSAPIASTSNLNSNQPSTSTNTSTEISTNLSDGSVLTVPRAREFMDFYCNKFKFGKPDISLTGHSSKKEKSNGKNKKVRLVSENGWKATMTVGGSRIGFADAKSKKEATQNVYLDTVKYLEQSDPDLFKLFLSQVKSGKALGTVPHVYFNLSNDLEDDVRLIYQDIKESLLFAKRPRPAGVIQSGEANDESKSIPTGPKKKKSRWDSHVNPNNNGEVAMKRKSEELLDKLQNFQIDPRVSKMREQRRSLPVSQRSADLLVKIELNSVIIVMAATGSGKTTQVPQILFDDYITKEEGSKCNVVCTQPRRIAAISVAERIARERGESLGDTIGYQVRFDAKLPKKNGSITFCTTGIFLRRLQSSLSADDGDGDDSNDYLDSLTHVVIDEVHERDVETDLLLVVIKKLLEDRKRKGKKEIKLILMSATIDPTLFQNYFASESTNNSSVKKLAPVVEIPGRSFPVEKHFLEETFKDIASLRLTPKDGQWVFDQENVQKYLERELNQGGGLVNASDQVNQNSATEGSVIDDLELPYPLISLMIAFVLTKSADGHVLVFLPGLDEIKAIANILADTQQCPLLGLNFNDKSQFEIHFLHSSIPIQDQQLVFEDPPPGVRRIILSTNIAETSITIPNVVYVVDTGRVKEKRFDPERHLSSLVSAWVGTSNLNQRAVRYGRHRPGEYYGVLSKARYEKLSVHQTVEMMRVDLSNVVMHIKALDIPGMEVEEVLDSAIEPPSSERVKAAMEKLRLVGALDSNKSLTSLGHVLLQLPVDVPIGKMCLYGAFFKSLDPVLSLAAILTARDPFMAPLHLKKEADAVKDSWSPTDFRSDPLCILRAFNKWNEYQKKGEYHLANRFCGDNFLSKITLAGILQVKEHLFQSMEKAGIIDLVMGQENDRNRMNGNDLGFGGGRGYRRERLSETHPELNRNSGSTPLLAALIAVSSVPNFAIKAGKESFRTSQDKTCFIHPSSVCHSKHTKNKPTESQTGEKELFAFSEKVRNTSGQTSSNNSNPQTNLRGCTRLDPLTYMLFGTVNVSTTHNGIECDGWLPMVGNLDALDSVESLKKAMDACMLRVFEGIGKTSRNKGRNANFSGRNGNQSQITNGSQNGFENSENLRDDLSLSPQEIEEFHSLTSDIVEVLDAYAKSRSGDGSNANSRASTRPATPNSGYYPSSNSNQGFSNSAPQSTYGGGGGSHVASNNSSSAYLPPNFGRQGGGFNSGPPSSAGGRSGYSSPYGGGPAIPLSMNYHQGSSGLNPNSIQSGSSGWGSNSAYGTTNSMPTSSSETPSSMSHNWRSGGK